MTILDTSVVVAATERRDAAAITAIRACARRTTRSMFVDAELYSGVEVANMTPLSDEVIAMREATARVYHRLSEAPATWDRDVVASNFGWITGLCASEQLRLGQNDRWILAEAMAVGVVVLTADQLMDRVGRAIGERMNWDEPLTQLVEVG